VLDRLADRAEEGEVKSMKMKWLVAFGVLGLLLLPRMADAAPAKQNVLPQDMIGLWSLDPEDCAKDASESHMTVEPKSIMFYEDYRTIKRVIALPDGFLRASGTAVSEPGERPAPMSLMLKRVAPDRLQVGKTDSQIYHRCPKTVR
jgi:hypothetical protein